MAIVPKWKRGKARSARRSMRPLRRRKVAKLSKPVVRAVNRIVSRRSETKYVAQPLFTRQVPIYGDTFPSGATTGQIYEMIPDLFQGTAGTTEYQRVGVKVNPTRLTADVDLRFNNLTQVLEGGTPLDRASWDIDVHMWYGYVRRYKNEADVLANNNNILNNLLENGQGTTLRWGGGPYDHFNRVNKEWFNLKHKVVRMYRPLGAQNLATVAGGLTTYFPQDIHKVVRLGFKLPKTLLYNETNPSPENYAPILIIGYQHRDGTQASNSTTDTATLLGKPALMMNVKRHMYFKDA